MGVSLLVLCYFRMFAEAVFVHTLYVFHVSGITRVRVDTSLLQLFDKHT